MHALISAVGTGAMFNLRLRWRMPCENMGTRSGYVVRRMTSTGRTPQ